MFIVQKITIKGTSVLYQFEIKDFFLLIHYTCCWEKLEYMPNFARWSESVF